MTWNVNIIATLATLDRTWVVDETPSVNTEWRGDSRVEKL